MTQIRELEPVLCHADRTSQLIWTSSSNAHRSAFSIEDVQHRTGTQPYSSSKYASDLLSLALNTHYNKQVGSHTQEHFFLPLLQWIPVIVVSLLSRACIPLSLALVLWWLAWPMASCPPSQPFSGPCLCLSFGLWVHMWPNRLILETVNDCLCAVGGVKRKTETMSLSLLWSQIRILTNTFTLTPYNGAEALVGKPFIIISIHTLVDMYSWMLLAPGSSGYLSRNLNHWTLKSNTTV